MYFNRKTLVATLLLSLGVSAGAGAVEDPDQRQTLRLPPDERHMVLEEMRNFVVALQTMIDGLSKDDMEQVARAANKMGSGAAHEIPDYVVAKLPEPFKQIAGTVHSTFDIIALDAADLGDVTHTLGQIGGLMQNCIACHSMYQVVRE
jgi:cytochrome c556